MAGTVNVLQILHIQTLGRLRPGVSVDKVQLKYLYLFSENGAASPVSASLPNSTKLTQAYLI